MQKNHVLAIALFIITSFAFSLNASGEIDATQKISENTDQLAPEYELKKEKVIIQIPEEMTESNLLNKLDTNKASIQSTESIPVIIIPKYQPIHNSSGYIKEKHAEKINTYTTRLNQILGKNRTSVVPKSVINPKNNSSVNPKEKIIPPNTTSSDRQITNEMLSKEEKEKEIRRIGANTVHNQLMKTLTIDERTELNETMKNLDYEDDMLKKEIYDLQSSLIKKSQEEIMEIVTNCGGIVTGNSTIINSIFARMPSSCLYDLKNSSTVLAVYENKMMKAQLDVSVPSTYAPTWHYNSYTGINWDLAVLDTGIDDTHPAITVDYAKVFHNDAQYSPYYDDDPLSTDDLHGHGTHVAGIIASTDTTYKGIAYGMDALINAKFGWRDIGGNGQGLWTDAMQAIDWSVLKGADVISLSYGGFIYDDDCEMCRYLDSVVDDLGISTVVAAGNEGSTTASIGEPAIAYNILSVADVDDHGTVSRSDDTISPTSSRGPTIGGRTKPDIAAPGTNIKSAAHNWEGLWGLNPDFVDMSGTSMATPHVAGSILLILDYAGYKRPEEIKSLLLNTADNDYSFSNRNEFGWGYIDLNHAYVHKDDTFRNYLPEGGYKFYQGYAFNGDKATLVWNRHVRYNGANYPTQNYTLNDLDLYLFNEANNTYLDVSYGVVDNVEQVESTSDSASVIIKVNAYTTNYNHHLDTENFALTTEEGFIEKNGPNISITESVPLKASTLINFIITAYIQNTGDLKAHDVGVTLNIPSEFNVLSGEQTQRFNLSAGGIAMALWIVNATNGTGTYNLNTYATSYSYGETFSTITSSRPIEVITRDSLNGSNTPVAHNCSYYNSVIDIDSIKINNPLIVGRNSTITIDWKGWHYGDQNYWAFFLNNSTTPISTCVSFVYDSQYIAYAMNCTITIPSDISAGKYLLKITANDFNGYCNPDETGVDAQYSMSTDISVCTPNWVLNNTWSACTNDIKYKNYYDTNGCDLASPPPTSSGCRNNPLTVTIITPTNTTYENQEIFINTYAGESGETVSEMNESIDGGSSYVMCNHCSAYAHYIIFQNGYHEITAYATDYYNNTANKTTGFIICAPAWTLNNTWTTCIDHIQFKNYYDSNNCGLAPPESINQSCNIPPSMVTNLHTTFANESAITWEWTNPPEPDYYVAIVYYGNSEQCKGPSCTFYYADSIHAPQNSTTIRGLNESTEYFVLIYTYDTDWNGNYTAPGLISSNNITGWTTSCAPSWTLNNTWSACTDGYQYKRYHDLNFCNNPEGKPTDIKKRCPTSILEIYRTLPPSASIGQTFNVTLEVDVNESKKPTAYVIYETIPEGFDTVTTGGMSYAPSTRTLKLMVYESTYYGTKVEDRTITYTLKYKKEHTTVFSGYSRYSASDHPIWGDNNFTGIIDRTPPTVFIIYPEDNKTYRESKTINVTAYADEIGEMRESVDGNTSVLICTDCSSIFHNITLENGNHNITIYATDAAGNTGNHTHNFKIDVCIPNWILNSTWSSCINETQTKNYYDINNCNKTETKPKDLIRNCSIIPPPIEVFRFVQPMAFVGENFNITLQIEVNESRKPKSYVLYETIPEGFNMTNTGGMQYTASTRTLKLMVYESTYFNTHVEDRIITYTLKPTIQTTGSFIGYIRYNILNYDTEGDNTVEVNS